MIRVFAALLALLASGWAPAQAPAFPKFDGLVVDAANALPADRKAALVAKLEALQQETHRQLVVATVPSLGGDSVDDYANRLFRAWGIGLDKADNGALLLVAPAERQVRIEVGYGLEPVLTDALTGAIVRQSIVPAFKRGDLPGGIEAGADAIAAQLRLPDAEAKAKVDAAAREFDRTHRRGATGAGVPLGLIFWGLVIGFVVLAAARRRNAGTAQRWGGSGGMAGGGSNWPIWLWMASELADSHRGRDDRDDDGGGGWGGFGGGGGGWGGGGSDGSWGGGGFTGGGGGSSGGGGASGSW